MAVAAMSAMLIGATLVPAEAQSGPRFTLTGVVVVEGGAGRAWLQEPSLTKNEIISVRGGERIGPYRLTKVLEDRVELEGPSGKFWVPLAGAAAPAAPPVAATPAPRPVATNEPDPLEANRQQVLRNRQLNPPPGRVTDFAEVLKSLGGASTPK